jgi:TolA-binding protein
MKDPERLLEGTTTDFERTVLRAARLEQPSVAQRRRMRRALFFAEIGFLTAGFKAAAGIGNQLVVVAVIAGVLAGTGSSSLTTSSHHRPQTYAPATVQPAINPASVGQAPAITDDAPNGIRAEELTLETNKDRDVKTAPRTVAPVKTIDLREEIRLLDEARIALRSKDPGRALSTVNRYLAQFPRGSFRQEASVLRIEALAMNGNKTQAATEAKRFMTTHPSSPHVDKLQRITQSATGPTKP